MKNTDSTNLIVDQIYRGSRQGNAADDPLPKLLGVDSGAGFRHLGKRPNVETLKLLVLKSSMKEPDWPDSFDTETGIFTYFGDRRSPGELHKTPRQGNQILANLFEARHRNRSLTHFPPILMFANTGVYRDVRFYGLAVPGAEGLSPDDNLVAIWRSAGPKNLRFQNYCARFTVLGIPVVEGRWLDDVRTGNATESPFAPRIWLDWLKNRKYKPLQAPREQGTRTKDEQLPTEREGKNNLGLVRNFYRNHPYNSSTVHSDWRS